MCTLRNLTMDKTAYATFNEYRELTKARAEIGKAIEAIKPALRGVMTDNRLVDEETGEMLVEVTVVKKRIFNQEDFRLDHPELYDDYCYDKEEERINIKLKEPKQN